MTKYLLHSRLYVTCRNVTFEMNNTLGFASCVIHFSCDISACHMLGIKWQDKIPDTEVLARAGLPSIHTLLIKAQLRWAGHVARMSDNRLPKKLMFGELQSGKRRVGGPKKRYKDTLKASLKSFNIEPDTWEQAAQNRKVWRASVFKGGQAYERDRTSKAERKRQARKENTTSSSPGKIACPHCTRTFRAQIGLISHLRTHPKKDD